MRSAAFLICLASGPQPRPNAAHFALACNCLLSRRELSYMPKSCARDANSIAVPRADTHNPYAHIRRTARPRLSFAARGNLTEMRGRRRGQRSLVSARRRDQHALEQLNRNARRRQRPWLHDQAEVAPGRGLRSERLAERSRGARDRVLVSYCDVTPSTRKRHQRENAIDAKITQVRSARRRGGRHVQRVR